MLLLAAKQHVTRHWLDNSYSFSLFFRFWSQQESQLVLVSTVYILTLCLSLIKSVYIRHHVKFPGWKMHVRTWKQYMFRSIAYPLSVLCVWMKILPHAGAKKKTKRLKGFKFGTFMGRSQVAATQICWSRHVFCRDKHTLVFVATNLWSPQKWCLWQLPSMIKLTDCKT